MCTFASCAARLFVYLCIVGTCVHSYVPSINSSIIISSDYPVVYKCLRVPLAQVLVIPERLSRYSVNSGRLLLASKPRRSGTICEHQVAIHVRFDSKNESVLRSACNFSVEHDGQFRIGGSLIGNFVYLPEHYCFSR